MAKAAEMTMYLESRPALAATHGALKRFVEKEGRELLCRMLSKLGASRARWIADILRTFNAFTGLSIR